MNFQIRKSKLPLIPIWLKGFKWMDAIVSSSKQSKLNNELRDVKALMRRSTHTTHAELGTFCPPFINADDSIAVADVFLSTSVGLSHGDVCLPIEPFQCHDDLPSFILENRVLVVMVLCHAN